jgi:hypothetical protein
VLAVTVVVQLHGLSEQLQLDAVVKIELLQLFAVVEPVVREIAPLPELQRVTVG